MPHLPESTRNLAYMLTPPFFPNEEAEHGDPVVRIHFSKFTYAAHGQIYRAFLHTPEVERLRSVSQLGTLQTVPGMHGLSHPRIAHTLDAAVMMELVLTREGFSDRSVAHGIVSMLLHDAAMPPYSDQGKLACREELEEEDNIGPLLDRSKPLRQLFAAFNLDREEVIAAIQGKHTVLGPLCNSRGLDLDKIAYLSEDLFYKGARGEFAVLKRTVASDPRPFDIIDNLHHTEGTWVFTNHEQVYKLLYIRAYLTKHLYHPPLHNAKEAFLERDLPKLWQAGLLDLDAMLTLTDEGFASTVARHLGQEQAQKYFSNSVIWFTEHERHEPLPGESLEDLYARLQSTHTGKEDMVVRMIRPFGSGTTTRILHEGRMRRYNEVYPEKAKIIDDLTGYGHVGVYRELPIPSSGHP